MHNIKDIRNDLDFFKKKLKERNTNVKLNELIEHDKNNRDLIQKKEKFEQEKKNIIKI